MASSNGWFQSAGTSTFDPTRKKASLAGAPRGAPLRKLSQSVAVRPKLPPSQRCGAPEVTQNPGRVFSLYAGVSF